MPVIASLRGVQPPKFFAIAEKQSGVPGWHGKTEDADDQQHSKSLTVQIRSDGTEDEKHPYRLIGHRPWLCIRLAISSDGNCADRDSSLLIRQWYGRRPSPGPPDQRKWHVLWDNRVWRDLQQGHGVLVQPDNGYRDGSVVFRQRKRRRATRRRSHQGQWRTLWHHLQWRPVRRRHDFLAQSENGRRDGGVVLRQRDGRTQPQCQHDKRQRHALWYDLGWRQL